PSLSCPFPAAPHEPGGPFDHPAHRRPSPKVFALPKRTLPTSRTRPRRFPDMTMCFMPCPPAAPSVSFGEQQRHSLDYLLVELGEATSRIAIAVILAPCVPLHAVSRFFLPLARKACA